MEPFIRMEDLGHVYHPGQADETVALSHVNLSIQRGEFVAVLGANGSGKSTLAKHLNAILLPTSGRCIVAGMDTREEDELWKIRQQVGMVFQNPDNQIIAAIVEDDVAFGPENLGVPSPEIGERVRKALRSVNMERFRGFAPHLLSGGQKQRVAIAGALAMETNCIVLDEPTAMLDPQGRSEVLGIVRRLHEERGITIVYITHFMEEAAVADRVVIMEGGRVRREGTPREILTDAEKMRRIGLDAPLAAEIAGILRKRGIQLPADILTDEDLAVALANYGRKEGNPHAH